MQTNLANRTPYFFHCEPCGYDNCFPCLLKRMKLLPRDSPDQMIDPKRPFDEQQMQCQGPAILGVAECYSRKHGGKMNEHNYFVDASRQNALCIFCAVRIYAK